jgi:hypothetical protein
MELEGIDVLLLKSSQNDLLALRALYLSFIDYTWLAPRSLPDSYLNNSEVNNPSGSFFDFLTLTFENEIVVPIFSKNEYFTDWSSDSLELREVQGSHLLKVIPDTFWISINPGQEISKDISPWEIKHLLHGAEGINEIIQELKDDAQTSKNTLELELCEPQFLEKLKNICKEFATNVHDLVEVSAGIIHQDESSSPYYRVEVLFKDKSKAEECLMSFKDFVNSKIIGDLPLSFHVKSNKNDFSNILPIEFIVYEDTST